MALATLHAFVVDWESGEAGWHWDLVTPETHLGAYASIPVSTNVVNPVTHAVRFFLASDAWSATNTAAELNGVRAGFGVWQSVPGTLLKFEEGGLLPPVQDIDPEDQTNVVFWVKDGTLIYGGNIDLGPALGLTIPAFIEDTLVGADIVLNGYRFGGYRWFTDYTYVPTDAVSQFVEAVVTHEVGHFVGLLHAPLGASTMFFRSLNGVSTFAGLSSDDVAGVQFLYPRAGSLTGRGRVQGRVLMEGAGILGATVVLEDAAGGFSAGTLSRSDGSFDLPAVPPGLYGLRATPLDPRGSSLFLVRGQDIYYTNYIPAETGFLPTTNVPVSVLANQIRTENLAVARGEPACRISHILKPTTDLARQSAMTGAARVLPGQSNIYLGVFGIGLPVAGATLRISGDGLTLTPVASSGGSSSLNLMAVRVDVSPNATPGLRSFIFQHGSDMAYANGFLEVQPVAPDFNFDGLDDRFQRKFFPLFTAAEAGPDADPDGDTFNNRYEYLAGSDPTSAASLPIVTLQSVTVTANGSTLAWRGVPGGRYEVLGRDRFGLGSAWEAVGSVVTAEGYDVRFLDASATNRIRFYRVRLLP